ncbi:MAG: hypothetical protein O7D32_11475 [bacterium]|nr:hypothetical protein [bacterium]
MLCPLPDGALAIGLEYRNPEEQVLGIDATVLRVFATRPGNRTGFAEVGERHLFNMAGLVARYARAGMRGGRLGTAVSVVALSSDIGGEDLLQAEVFYRETSTVLVGASAGLHSARIDGFRPSFLATVSVQVAVAIERLVVGYSARNFRVAGEQLDGVDGTMYVALTGSRFVPVSRVRITRNGFWSISASLRVDVGPNAGVSVGYLGGTGSLSSAAHVHVRRVGVAVEVSTHPVLGLSKSLFVTWGAQ